MKKKYIFITLLIIKINFLNFSLCENELKCNLINITSGILNENYSITYNGKLYEYGLYQINTIKDNVEHYYACESDSLPCKFSDSLNITNGKTLKNGTILFGYMQFPIETYANVSYKYNVTLKTVKIDNENINVDYFTRVETAIYQRGCVNKSKPIIRFCCLSPYDIM